MQQNAEVPKARLGVGAEHEPIDNPEGVIGYKYGGFRQGAGAVPRALKLWLDPEAHECFLEKVVLSSGLQPLVVALEGPLAASALEHGEAGSSRPGIARFHKG